MNSTRQTALSTNCNSKHHTHLGAQRVGLVVALGGVMLL
jgi:hypothetical protein